VVAPARPRSGVVPLTLAVMLLTVAPGSNTYKARVHSLPEYNPAPKLWLSGYAKWLDREAGVRRSSPPSVCPSSRVAERQVVQEVAQQLAASGWFPKSNVLPKTWMAPSASGATTVARSRW
jgi:hypothetical protein